METGAGKAYETILILDESSEDRAITANAIATTLPEASIEATDSVQDFRAHIESNAFDIIVLDHTLSQADGIELLHEIKLKAWDPAILVVCDAREPKDIAQAYNSGCHRCVIKQGKWSEELAPAIRHMLRMKRLEEENRRLVAKLTEANGMLSEKNKRLDEFSGTVAHDIRGPLGTISMKLEYIKDIYGDDLDERFKSIVDGTLESTRRLLDVIQAMYEYAKLSSKASHTQEINLELFVQEVIADLSFDDSLDIQIGIAELPHVWGNPGLLRKVFQNLISNAVKYSDKKITTINISCDGAFEKSIGEFAVLRVSDNGPGIPAAEQKEIFSMFRRGGGEQKEGIGIGLAVVKRIVELHYGSIEIESENNFGTDFVFSLPLEKVDLEV